MPTFIPLLNMKANPDATAHLYPCQIALQTQQILQATVFHAILLDVAAGQRVRQPGAINEIETELIDNGLDPETLKGGWQFFEQYKALFMEYVLQAAPITMKSHWDWYIRKLARFIDFARNHCGGPSLSKETKKRFSLLGKKESTISVQVDLLQEATGLSVNFPVNETLSKENF